MKNIALTAVIVGTLTIGAQAFALEFKPFVDGHKTIATQDAVVIGGQVYHVKADPQTIEEMQTRVVQLQALVYEAQTNKAVQEAGNKSSCVK